MLERKKYLHVLIFFLTCSCYSTKKAGDTQIHRLKFLSEFDLPYSSMFQQTKVGGLSGIDYNAKKNIYYGISDDRSERNNARFYRLQVEIKNYKIDTVAFLETVFLKNNKDSLYPGVSVDPLHTPDPESIRFNPKTDTYVWSSEGERIVTKQKTLLEDPAITEIDKSGKYIDTLMLPSQLHMSTTETGPRRNGVLEGLAFSDDYKTLYAAVEEPLYNDGPRAGLHDSSAITRIIKFDVNTKEPMAQYAYRIEPVAHRPLFPGAFIINGVSEILSLGKNKLLVIERSYSTGRPANTIRVFLADLSKATNIENVSSVKNADSIRIVPKKLLLNMDDLGFYIDNIEGVCFGPPLPNGHKSLIFLSDNNFVPIQKTQFLLFEIE